MNKKKMFPVLNTLNLTNQLHYGGTMTESFLHEISNFRDKMIFTVDENIFLNMTNIGYWE